MYRRQNDETLTSETIPQIQEYGRQDAVEAMGIGAQCTTKTELQI
jgi:hypothetical protein